MDSATFFLSSGRCGTQWLAKNLKEVYADIAVVEHEPILRKYLPKTLLGLRDPARSENAQIILDHTADIERHLEVKPYIECGWPCYGALRFFAQRFAGRIRIVHLTRHPIPTAGSMMTHNYYARTTILDTWALLEPTDRGVAFPEYTDRWQTMNRFERCLYFWAEINTLGLILERELRVPWLRVKYEDLFNADGLGRVLNFLQLPRREAVYAARAQSQDRWHHFRTDEELDLTLIRQHPKIMAVAVMLGYKPLEADEAKIRERYQSKSKVAPARRS
jgi:hypothetical protein